MMSLSMSDVVALKIRDELEKSGRELSLPDDEIERFVIDVWSADATEEVGRLNRYVVIRDHAGDVVVQIDDVQELRDWIELDGPRRILKDEIIAWTRRTS